ncbi:cysteine proteinase 1-like [Choristoneura fumiferana]|uniref:cysteine proteinase 1-like n=1 Tax=Choristoneura fumiferana TaxID=7141 RepID=UPI003D15D6B3
MFRVRVISVLLLVSNALVLLTADKVYYDLADAKSHFADFILKYNKVYDTEEDYNQRLEIFRSNLLRINELNVLHEATFGINKFADLTREEFEKTRLAGFPPVEINTGEKITVEKEWIADAPDSLDYRDEGLVTEVKDQGQCGSCYIFSAIGNIEGQQAKINNELISLSEQQALDCDKEKKDMGCNGGYMVNVIALMKEGGSVGEEDYPYTAKVGSCSRNESNVKVKILNATALSTPTEEELAGALAHYGPLAIALYMPDWQYYQDGVLTPLNCDNPPNHGVVLVGYGTVPGGRDYWIIKNSWGADWGIEGYFKLEKGREYCRIGKYYTATAEVEKKV